MTPYCHSAAGTEDSFMTANKVNMAGLTSAEAKKLQDKYGKNELTPQKKDNFLKKIFHIICEPMFLLLLAAAGVYLAVGDLGEGLLLGFFASDQVEAFAHAVTTAWYWPVDELAGVMTAAGFTVVGRGTRQDAGVRRHGWIEAVRD